MKRKLILCCAIVSMSSINGFALEITKGKLLSHKEWSTGDAQGLFQVSNYKMDMKKFLKKNGNPFSAIQSFTTLNPTTGKVGERSQISGKDFIYISNDSQSTQEYDYGMGSCAQSSDHVMHCLYYFNHAQLEPGGSLMDKQEPKLKVRFSQPGTYETTSFIWVYSLIGENQINNGSTSASSITITND